tara:strand:+ start:1517 stop:2074 length:558 start_codon:yes stop_codon:yes gene_type:complete
MNYKSIAPSHIHAAGSTIAIALVAISGYSVYTSWQSRQSGIESSQIRLSQVSEELSNAQQERGRLTNQISNLQSMVEEDREVIVPTSINELAVEIVALAEQHKLELDQFEPRAPITIDGNTHHPIIIRLTSPYKSLTDWLDEIHEIMPDIHVMSIAIRSTGAEPPVVSSDIEFNWYKPTKEQPDP